MKNYYDICGEQIVDIFSSIYVDKVVQGFYVGNFLKYVTRCGRKPSDTVESDAEKAAEYLHLCDKTVIDIYNDIKCTDIKHETKEELLRLIRQFAESDIFRKSKEYEDNIQHKIDKQLKNCNKKTLKSEILKLVDTEDTPIYEKYKKFINGRKEQKTGITLLDIPEVRLDLISRYADETNDILCEIMFKSNRYLQNKSDILNIKTDTRLYIAYTVVEYILDNLFGVQ